MIEFGIIVAAVVFIWLYVGKNVTEATTHSDESVVEQKEVVTVINIEETDVSSVAETLEPVIEAIPANKVERACVAVSVIPQDSTLRRHYMQNLMANKENAGAQIPEDSTLRRHYLQNLAAQEPCVEVIPAAIANTVKIPEDAVLKRHFIQQLAAEVAKEMSDRPTDSTLKRHYDTQLFNAIEARLQVLK
ncbi:MAG: hypothetical protein K9L22_04085 [Methylococcaceae bacterium]|nr:hypothetical protein [Methylococcaceae bacterium]